MSRIEYSASFEIGRSAQELFPLFSAEGETKWVPGWEYENIFGYTDLHEDYVFLTRNDDHASAKAIWIVKKYKHASYYIQFYKIEPM